MEIKNCSGTEIPYGTTKVAITFNRKLFLKKWGLRDNLKKQDLIDHLEDMAFLGLREQCESEGAKFRIIVLENEFKIVVEADNYACLLDLMNEDQVYENENNGGKVEFGF